MSHLDWYMSFIRYELEQHCTDRFTGNVDFKVNFKEGGIASCNIGQLKSIKMPLDGREDYKIG